MESDNKNSYEFEWMKAKGIPASQDTVVETVNICYNYLSSSLQYGDNRGHMSIGECNKVLLTCCAKVLAVLRNRHFRLPVCETVSCDDVISAFKEILQNKAVIPSALLLRGLVDLASCAAIIWILRTSKTDPRRDACERLLQLFSTGDKTDASNTMMTVSQVIKTLSASDALTEKLPQFLEEISDSLSQFLLYMHGHALYNQGCYKEALAICDPVSNLKDFEVLNSFPSLSNLCNLIGCCHAQLKCPQRALVNFRKAIQYKPCNIASILYNIALVTRKAGNCGVASNAMDLLTSSFKLEGQEEAGEGQEGAREETGLLVHHAVGLEPVFVSDISLWGQKKMENDSQKGLYFTAHENIRARNFSKALQLHDEIDLETMYPISLGNPNRKYFDISREQVIAERYLALCMCEDDVEFTFDLPCVATLRMEITHYSCEFEKSLEQTAAAVNDFVSRGKQLYYRLCTMLCYVKFLFDHKATEEYLIAEEINNMWMPKFYVKKHEHESIAEVEMIIDSLNHIQAKFLLNKAIMLSSENRNKEEIFQVLREVFKFHSHDVEIRWVVTLILWKLGQEGEACKTWMKTRGLDYDMSPEEITLILQTKYDMGERPKSEIQRRDKAILTEVLRSRKPQ